MTDFLSEQIYAAAQERRGQVGQNAANVPVSVPTDMQIHVERVAEAYQRLNRIHGDFVQLIARLYGEGDSCTEARPSPLPCGLMGEMTIGLSAIDAVAERLDEAAKRLSRLA